MICRKVGLLVPYFLPARNPDGVPRPLVHVSGQSHTELAYVPNLLRQILLFVSDLCVDVTGYAHVRITDGLFHADSAVLHHLLMRRFSGSAERNPLRRQNVLRIQHRRRTDNGNRLLQCRGQIVRHSGTLVMPCALVPPLRQRILRAAPVALLQLRHHVRHVLDGSGAERPLHGILYARCTHETVDNVLRVQIRRIGRHSLHVPVDHADKRINHHRSLGGCVRSLGKAYVLYVELEIILRPLRRYVGRKRVSVHRDGEIMLCVEAVETVPLQRCLVAPLRALLPDEVVHHLHHTAVIRIQLLLDCRYVRRFQCHRRRKSLVLRMHQTNAAVLDVALSGFTTVQRHNGHRLCRRHRVFLSVRQSNGHRLLLVADVPGQIHTLRSVLLILQKLVLQGFDVLLHVHDLLRLRRPKRLIEISAHITHAAKEAVSVHGVQRNPLSCLAGSLFQAFREFTGIGRGTDLSLRIRLQRVELLLHVASVVEIVHQLTGDMICIPALSVKHHPVLSGNGCAKQPTKPVRVLRHTKRGHRCHSVLRHVCTCRPLNLVHQICRHLSKVITVQRSKRPNILVHGHICHVRAVRSVVSGYLVKEVRNSLDGLAVLLGNKPLLIRRHSRRANHAGITAKSVGVIAAVVLGTKLIHAVLKIVDNLPVLHSISCRRHLDSLDTRFIGVHRVPVLSLNTLDSFFVLLGLTGTENVRTISLRRRLSLRVVPVDFLVTLRL